MKNSVDVIFFVEHKDRELESISAIANLLKDKGISSLILSTYFHTHYALVYSAKMYIFPYMLNRSDWPVCLIADMYEDTVLYMNMNWEQLLSSVNLSYKKPQDGFVKKQVKHLVWNDPFKDYLEKSGVDRKNIAVLGNPANDILYGLLDRYHEWRDLLSKEFSIDQSKKWLFLPMNYAWAFSSNKMIEGKIQKGYPADTAWEHREYAYKCLVEFIYFVDALSEMKEYEIIIRPHPSISEKDYMNVFMRELGYLPEGVLLNKAHSIREWIIASDIIGSSWSTSVWDAYNIGKEVFLFTPYERPQWLDVWWNSQIANIQNIDNWKTSKKYIADPQRNNSIENVTSYIVSCIEHRGRQERKSYRPLVGHWKQILKTLLLHYGIVKRDAYEYDRFDPILMDVDSDKDRMSKKT